MLGSRLPLQADRTKPIPLRWIGWTAAISLGAIHAWYWRNYFDEDGISYLDVADAYFHGDFHQALNAYWSPLYSWVIGLALRLVQPEPFHELAVVHIVNFFIFLAALRAFEYFLAELLEQRRMNTAGISPWDIVALPDRHILMIAYALFLLFSLLWIGIAPVQPDMLLSVFLYLALGLMLRLRRPDAVLRHFILLGAVLGLGYLCKAIVFPLSFVFLGLSIWACRERIGVRLRSAAVAAAVFLAVALPFLTALSYQKGRFTWGDTGKIVYAWFANGLVVDEFGTEPGWRNQFHWRGVEPGSGTPRHPTRKIFANPAIYEFDRSSLETYSPWYDPSYWCEGLTPRFVMAEQIKRVKLGLNEYSNRLRRDAAVPLVCVVLLLLLAREKRSYLVRVFGYGVVLVPCVAALGLYTLVYMSPRYVGAPTLAMLLVLLAVSRLERSSLSLRLFRAMTLCIVLAAAGQLAVGAARMAPPLWRSLTGREGPTFNQEMAGRLRDIGIQKGDKVAVIGYGAYSYWAHLAKVQIVSELYAETWNFDEIKNIDKILNEDGSLQESIVALFRDTGAKAIIAYNLPEDRPRTNWIHLTNNQPRAYAYSTGR